MNLLAAFEFFDVAFARLIFSLIVDALISGGYLLPDQRQVWVDGWAHIIGMAGGVIFLAIWQHNSHKKTTTTVIDKTIIPPQTTTTTSETMNVETEKPNVLDYLTK